ncbi:asparagine synthase-related protein [Gillisia sp. M10.2A]|uniref:asparagine synthase (glutamine-hydrolyzing) n=1 Tax=Gillisia lutea TaxID=2909668 RepID=A0ABS9EIH2_9FLAO|nr:asparagine synthase-related protein [Gillisia lutea]MCF4102651.1 asparagine synthase-related protein [Gillisia lutea]
MYIIKISNKKKDFCFPELENEKIIYFENFIININYDDFLNNYKESTTEVSFVETPTGKSSLRAQDNSELDFVKMLLNKVTGNLEIEKKILSGRKVYYHYSENQIIFSSHINLLRKAGVELIENSEILPEFFVHRFVTAPNTFYKNIYQLKPSETIVIKFSNRTLDLVKDVDYSPFKKSSNKELVYSHGDNYQEKIKKLLEKSLTNLSPVKDRVTSMLSGGLDSSILYKILYHKFNISTSFSTCYPFDNKKIGEAQYAKTAADYFKADHQHKDFSNNDYVRGVIESIYLAEEPLFHLQTVMFNLLFKNMPNNKIVISGQGADGFFGSPSHNRLYNSNKLKYRLLSFSPLPKIIWKFGNYNLSKELNIAKRYRNTRYLPLKDKNHFIWSIGNQGDKKWVAKYFKVSEEEINSNRLQLVESLSDKSMYEIMTSLDFIGDKSATEGIWSKIAEAHKNIIYYPFNNEELIKYNMSLPWNLKLKTMKGLLHYVARQNDVPDFIINRKKKGFFVSPTDWLSHGIMNSLIPLAGKVIDIEVLKELQETSKGFLFWNFLNYAIWKRLFINNESVDSLINELDLK